MKVSNIVNDALANGVNLSFAYSSKNNPAVTVRHVQPTEIINGNVLVAIDLDKGQYRRFLMDSMTGVREIG